MENLQEGIINATFDEMKRRVHLPIMGHTERLNFKKMKVHFIELSISITHSIPANGKTVGH